MSQDQIDFRTRVAAEKRERMRARLLSAIMQVYGVEGGRGVVVDDVVHAAGVSRGAFYRHFQSLDEALADLVSKLLVEIIATAETVFADVDDPVLGTAIGPQLLLYRAAMDPPWARFVSSTNLILGDPALHAVLVRTIGGGAAKGVFRFRSLPVATDVFVGGLLAGVRHLGSSAGDPADYISEVSRLLLTSLGTPQAAAEAVVAAARARIHEVGPSRLPWWRAP